MTIKYSQAGRQALNTFWLQTTGFDAATNADVATLCSQIISTWTTNVMPMLSSDTALVGVKCVLWATSYELEAVVAAANAGGNTNEPLSANASFVISFNIARIYRGGKPRIYLPGVCTNQMAPPRNLTTTAVGDWNDAFIAVLNDINSITTTNLATVFMGVLSRILGGVARTPPVFFAYLGAGAQSRICTQKRRLGNES